MEQVFQVTYCPHRESDLSGISTQAYQLGIGTRDRAAVGLQNAITLRVDLHSPHEARREFDKHIPPSIRTRAQVKHSPQIIHISFHYLRYRDTR